MTDKKVTLVTKAGCPYCKKAKATLNETLGGRYNGQIDFVEQESDSDRYRQIQEQYGFQTVPAFIDNQTREVLSSSEANAITQFLEKHLAG